MISLRYYLDTRKPSSRPDGKYPLKLAVTKHGDTALMSMLAYATREEWDPKAQRLKGGRLGDAGKVNTYLARQMLRFEEILRDLVETGDGVAMTPIQIRDAIQERCMDAGAGLTFGEYFGRVRDEKSPPTRKIFDNARKAIERAVPRIMYRPLASITSRDVDKIDAWLRGHYSQNTRNGYVLKLTQVLKRAHREGLNAADAGRNVKIKAAAAKSKALTRDQIRDLLNADPPNERGREALDFFRLSFFLRAINPVDLWRVTPDDVFNGRLMYERSKTGKDYSVRVEPEAEEVIARRGNASHLWALSGKRDWSNYNRITNYELTRIARSLGLPPVTMYWARHTLASLMLETGAPVEIIAAALGHSYGPRITMGYVTIRERNVDDAVRRVYDYVAGTWEPER